MRRTLGSCRWVYNKVLKIRKIAWENEHRNVGYYDTKKLLPLWKEENPWLKEIYSQVLQNVVERVDLAYRSFFRRTKKGENPGYPRFKGLGRYNSFTFPQAGFKLRNNTLHLSKIGDVPIILHRELLGTVNTLTVRKTGAGKWFASFSVEIEDAWVSQRINPAAGIDLGIHHFAALSNGELIDNPKFFREDEQKLARVQRRLSKKGKGTDEWRKHVMIVSKIHERIANRRKDFIHKISRDLVTRFGTIFFEDLNIRKMQKEAKETYNHGLAKSIADAAWGTLVQFTEDKAEEAGSKVILVDSYDTSQRCARCGKIVQKDLSIRIHECSCGFTIDRDINASLNILGLGLQSLGIT